MFILGMIIGAMFGGMITLILYACIIVGKNADEKEVLYNRKENFKNKK